MRHLFLRPAFLFGLLLRVLLIAALAPTAVTDWYAPFLEASVTSPTSDPWTAWMGANGDAAAFPYGYAMWLVLLPMTALAGLTGLPVALGYTMTLLVFDFLLLLLLRRQGEERQPMAVYTYWLSPILLVGTYVLGLNDLIPAVLLAMALLLLRLHRFRIAGFAVAAAVSAKLSMLVALPFLVVYLFHNRSLRAHLADFSLGLGIGATILWLPYAFSTGGISMLLGNPEIGKIYHLSVETGNHLVVYAVPLLYLLMLYYTWRVRRLNFELFQSMTGLAFLLIVLLTPASPGWFIWCLPFLVLYQYNSDRTAIGLSTLFTLLYVLVTLLGSDIRLASGVIISPAQWLPDGVDSVHRYRSLLLTAMTAIGIVLALRIWRENIKSNDFFRLSRKPFVIGVAGDSGAGKDTYAGAIEGLFGAHSVSQLSGDDYHLWDRQKPMWQVMTHLNPMANNLEAFANDLVSLSDGKDVLARRYDHETGKMSRPHRLHSNDFIIASGLHALYLPILRDCCDLKVYLDISEPLRHHFKLRRDVTERGHTRERVLAAFERREPDSARFIRPQAAFADLILALHPIHPQVLEGNAMSTPRLRLEVRTRHGFNELSLTRVLVGVCGLHVDITPSEDGAELIISIEGESSAEDVAMAAKILCSRVTEFLDLAPRWQDGVTGLMQLITLTHIDQALTKRIL